MSKDQARRALDPGPQDLEGTLLLKKPAAVSQDDQLEELFDDIAAEIEERIAYLKEIESIGKSPEIEQRIKNEVAERIGELQKIREM